MLTDRRRGRRLRRLLAFYALAAAWLTTTAMHIPDGYLSPLTTLVMFLLVAPFWYLGLRQMRRALDARSVPLIALLSAFSFVIMMFNIPLPGGTTGHAVGGALAAIILGPEIATIAVSIALIIQAFFFGDGGILAIGANCFNMAVVLPYVAYGVYRLVSGRAAPDARRRLLAAFLAGWAGLTLSALFTALQFGLQPLLFHAADGTPLYAPYPLSIAIPAMVIPHLLVASVVEGAVTALIVAYLQRTNRAVLAPAAADAASGAPLRGLWIGLGLLIIATPLGLLAPGTAWGEWSSEQLAGLGLTVVPQGLKQLEGLWGAPLAGYELPPLGNAGLGYVFSAVLGLGLIAVAVWLFTTLLAGRPSRRRNAFERTLAEIGHTLEQSLFAEEMARRPGLLQALDPRVKLASVLALLMAVSLARSLGVILGLYALTLFLAWRSAIPMGFFIKRVWLLLPFFTGLIALPAFFITPGPALAALPFGLVITQTGALTGLFLLTRVSVSVSLGLLLILTTPWNTLLKALSSLKVPDAFVLILGMTYRYIYLLLHTANDMFLSRQSRVVGRLSGDAERRILAANAGVLLNKSLHLSSEVYLAMQSRGYRGAPRVLDNFQMKRLDWAWSAALAVVVAGAVWLGR